MDSADYEAQLALADAVRRLGDLIVTRPLSQQACSALARDLEGMALRFDDASKVDKVDRFGGKNRVEAFRETGAWPVPPPDGSPMEFDIASIVGGALNPFGLNVKYFRDGDDAVGRVSVARPFEGPPGRVHGGVQCAIFDEVMGSVFQATGTSSAFTGELKVRFVGPAPVESELEFRAREIKTEGRKRFIEAEGIGPDGVFSTATAVFVDLRPEHLPESVL